MIEISEQVKYLRELSSKAKANTYAFEALSQSLMDAADTIERLSEKISSLDRESDWIECESGKLPDRKVICCDVCGEIIIGYIHETYESEQTGFSAENSYEYMYNCVKWMELSKP